MVCESPCPGQEYLFMGEMVLQLCRYPEMPRIPIHYFTRLNYSSYTAVNSLSAAKCLCWDQSWEEKRKMKVSFWLEWAVNLNVSYLSGAELQYFSWKRNAEFLLVEDGLTVSSMSDRITEFMTRRHSRGGDPSGTPMPWIKGPYLVPAQAQGRLCCPMVESQTPEQRVAQV